MKGSIQGQLNELRASLNAERELSLKLQLAYDRQAAQLRRAVGIIRDCHRATGPAAEFLESVK